MRIDQIVRAACKSLFNGRFYKDAYMQKDGGLPQFPAGRFQLVGGEAFNDICGSDDGSTDNTRVQIEFAAPTGEEREQLLPLVMGAMQGLTPPATRDGAPITLFDEETRTYRAIVFYTFAPSSATT